MQPRRAAAAGPGASRQGRQRAPRPGLALAELIEAQRLLRAGRADLAEPVCRRLLRVDPDEANAHNLLSVALGRLGRPGEAEAHSRRALALQPGNPGFLLNLAERLREQSRHDDAIEIYRRVLEIDPEQPEALNGLARALAAKGRFEEALEPAGHAAELAPDAAERHALYGEILAMARGPSAALEALGRAVDLDPERLDWWRNLARVALRAGEVVWLERAAERLLRADPEDAEAKVQLANARYRQDDLAGACRILETVQTGGVNGANAQNLLGIALARQGRVRAGLAAIDRALALAPDAFELASNGLLHGNYDPDLSPAQLRDRHTDFAARFAEPLAPTASEFLVDPDPERPLRIGYLSPDFRRHSVAYFVAPLLAEHDPAAVQTVCYASVARPDAITDHLRSLAFAWHDVRHLDDAALAERIRADRIDILVELAGHTLDNRLLACARRPAPVQIAYLGYPNTTGLTAIDYRITDPIADPDGFDDHYTETLIRLPRCFLSYAVPAHAPEIAPPPVLTKGHITFGSFNNLSKINDEVVTLWAAILQQVDGSRLLLKASGTGDPETRPTCTRLSGHMA
jgi:protein O-GlcNAc transferase